MRFSTFIDVFVVALYNETELRGQTQFKIREILEKYSLELNPTWQASLFDDYTFSKRVNARQHIGPIVDQRVAISSEGIRWVEDEIGENAAQFLEQNGAVYIDDDAIAEVIPASDRIVSFDHNSAPYQEIEQGVLQLREEFRGANDLPIKVAERSRLQASLDAAVTLWQASELKAIQVKIGLIMAIEDAASVLVSVGKAVGAALLVDAIKSLIKAQTAIDLDQL